MAGLTRLTKYRAAGRSAIVQPYSEDQDDLHASAIYSMLENEIVPLFYQNQDSDGDIPTEWVRRMKTCIANLTPRFGCGRMLAEYMSELYQPAHNLWQNVSKNAFELARNRTGWDARINNSWHSIRFLELGEGPADQVMSGADVPIKALIELGGLDPSEVRVEAVVGQIGVNGQLQETFTLALNAGEARGSAVLFANEFTVQQTGRLGYSVRISPNHFDNPLTRPCNALLKWVSD